MQTYQSYYSKYTAGTRTWSASAAGATNHIKFPSAGKHLTKNIEIYNDSVSAPILLVSLQSSNSFSAGSVGVFKVYPGEVFVKNFQCQGISLKASGTSKVLGRFFVSYE